MKIIFCAVLALLCGLTAEAQTQLQPAPSLKVSPVQVQLPSKEAEYEKLQADLKALDAQWQKLSAELTAYQAKQQDAANRMQNLATWYDGVAPKDANSQEIQQALSQMNMQFLALQEATQMESRRFQTLSNASKARHDIALNAIRNMK